MGTLMQQHKSRRTLHFKIQEHRSQTVHLVTSHLMNIGSRVEQMTDVSAGMVILVCRDHRDFLLAWALYWIHPSPHGCVRKLLQSLAPLGRSPDQDAIFRALILDTVLKKHCAFTQ